MFDLPDPEFPPSSRLRITLELYADGIGMMRRGLRRDFPQATDEELRKMLIEWLRERPGAEQGDCIGRPRQWAPST